MKYEQDKFLSEQNNGALSVTALIGLMTLTVDLLTSK